MPALLGQTSDGEGPTFWHYPVYHHDVPAAAVRIGPWKLIYNLETGSTSLFHLGHDLGDYTDRSEAYPEKTNELRELLKKWRLEVGAEMPVPNPAFDEAKRTAWAPHADHPNRRKH